MIFMKARRIFRRRSVVYFFLFIFTATLSFPFSVVLLITGEVGGNAIYEMMVAGAEKAAQEKGFSLRVVEGGYNAARWEPLLTSLSASGIYDVVITFTEGMPHSVEKVARAFPSQKVVLIDGIAPKMDNVFSLGFRDEEMAFLAGVYAALMVQYHRWNFPEPTIGLLAGDIYPAMTERMKPAYEYGAKSVIPSIQVLFSVAGSWGDPNKGRDLSRAQYDQGAAIIFTIAGGTGVGAIQAAQEKGRYIIGVDSNYIHHAPNAILACALKHADRAMYDVIVRAFEGTLPFGKIERWGILEGGIGFTIEDPNFQRNTPQIIQDEMKAIIQKLVAGDVAPLP